MAHHENTSGTLRYNVPRGTTVIAGQQAIVSLTEMIFYTVLLRILTLQDIGRVSLLAAVLGIFTTITQLALPTAATRFISKSLGQSDPQAAKEVANASLRLLLTIAAPSLLVSLLFSPWVANSVLASHDTMLLIVGTFLTGFVLDITSLIGGCFLGTGNYNRLAYQNLLYTPLSRGLGIFLALIGLGLEGVVLGWMTGSLATLLLSLRLRRDIIHAETEGTSAFPTRPLIAFSLPIFAYAAIGLGQGWGDIAILQAELGNLSVTGAYFLVVTSVGWLQLMWVPLATAIAPALSACYAKGGERAVQEKLSSAFRMINLTVIPLSASMVAVAPTLLAVLYGPELVLETLPATLLLSSLFFTAQGLLLITGLHAVGNTRPLLKIAVIATAIELAIVGLTASFLGPTAGALGRTVMAATTALLAYRALSKRVEKLEVGNCLYPALLLSIAVSISLVLANQVMILLETELAVRMILLLPVLGVSYLLASRKLSVFTVVDLNRLEEAFPHPLHFLTRSIQRLLMGQGPQISPNREPLAGANV